MVLSKKEFWDKSFVRRQMALLPDPHLLFDFELMKLLEKFLPRQRGLSVIEMGCGGSKWLPYFSRRFGYKVFGIDYSEIGVKKAKENLQALGCSGKIWHLNFINELPVSLHNSFDILISLGVIEHFTEPEKILEIFARLLRKDGMIITVCPNMGGLSGYMQRFFSRETYDLHKIFRLDRLKLWHVGNNFQIVHSSYLYLSDFSKIFPIYERLPRFFGCLYLKVNYAVNLIYILSYKIVKEVSNIFPALSSTMVIIARKEQ